MAEDRGKLLENFSQDLDLENEESDYSEMSDPNDNDQPRLTYIDLKISVKLQKHTLFENLLKKKYS